ncbi:hypothetical protein L1887_14499 [Cichorium endivia]|nr:hypothetical protein L1887_14499 [Cichorium endivia]
MTITLKLQLRFTLKGYIYCNYRPKKPRHGPIHQTYKEHVMHPCTQMISTYICQTYSISYPIRISREFCNQASCILDFSSGRSDSEKYAHFESTHYGPNYALSITPDRTARQINYLRIAVHSSMMYSSVVEHSCFSNADRLEALDLGHNSTLDQSLIVALDD